MADARRSSILKPPKQRAPLQEVNSLNIHYQDDLTSTTFTQNILRRVSFAGTSTVKEFDAQAESVLVCHTPAYEESFAASDSSVPSDHSSGLSSRSTMSIEDQSSLPAPSKDTSHNVVLAQDEIFLEFGVPICSLPSTKIPQRRARFSIGSPSHEEDTPEVMETPPACAIPASSFYGKQTAKPKRSAIPSTRSQGFTTIDPFTLRPKTVSNSPKSQPKRKSISGSVAETSQNNKSTTFQFTSSPNDSASSEMELTEAISGNIFVTSPSPSSAATGTPPSGSTLQRTFAGSENEDSTRFDTPGWKDKTAYDEDMDFTRVMPSKILDRTGVRPSDPGDRSLHCTSGNFPQPVNQVGIRDEQPLVTVSKIVTCTTNSVVMGLSRSVPESSEMSSQAMKFRSEGIEPIGLIHGVNVNSESIQTRSEREMKQTNVNLAGDVTDRASVTKFNTTVLDSEGMELTEVLSSFPVWEQNSSAGKLGELDARNVTVYEPHGMDFTRVIPSSLLSRDSETDHKQPHSVESSDLTINGSEYMPVSRGEKSAPNTADNTLNDSIGMDFTEAIPYVPEFLTPGRGKLFHAAPPNEILNDTVGMEITNAMPSASILLVSENVPSSTEMAPAPRTYCDSVSMELTRTAPANSRCNISEGATDSVIMSTEANKTVYQSSDMDFTKVGPAPILVASSKANESLKLSSSEVRSTKPVKIDQSPSAGFQVSLTGKSIALETCSSASPLSNDAGLQRTENLISTMKLITLLTTTDIRTSATSKTSQGTVQTSNESAVAHRTLCDSVSMELTQTAPANPLCNTSEGATESAILSTEANKTVYESSGMDFTKVGPAPILVDSSKPNEGLKLSFLKERSDKPIEIERLPSTNFHVDSSTKPFALETSTPVSQSLNDLSLPPIKSDLNENLTSSTNLAKLPTRDEIRTAATSVTLQETVSETVQLIAKPTDLETSPSNTVGFHTHLSSQTSVQETVQLVSQHMYVEDRLSRTEDLYSCPTIQMSVQGTVKQATQPIGIEASESSSMSETQVQDTVQLVTKPLSLSSSDNIRSVSKISQEITPHIANISRVSPEKQLCWKRSFDEVDKTEPDEVASPKSRHLDSPLGPAPLAPPEIVIPSSRSPSPVEHDSSTRFPGLRQSFSGSCSENDSKAAPSSNQLATNDSHLKELHTSSAEAVPQVSGVNLIASGVVIDQVSSSPSLMSFPPISTDEAVPLPANFPEILSESVGVDCECIGTSTSQTSREVSGSFIIPDESNIANLSLKTKSPDRGGLSLKSDKMHHVSIMDVSLPSMTEISDCSIEQDGSSRARLYATLLQAENNLSVFYQTREEDASIVVSTNVLNEVSAQGVHPCSTFEGRKVPGCEEPETEEVKEEMKHIFEEHGRCNKDILSSEKKKLSLIGEPVTKEVKEEQVNITEELARCSEDILSSNEKNLSVCEESETQRREEEGGDVTESEKPRSEPEKVVIPTWDPEVGEARELIIRGSPSVGFISNESPLLMEPDRRNLFNKSTSYIKGKSRMELTAIRPADEIIRAHRLEYRKRGRCNWIADNVSDGEWSFKFLDDSVELRMQVERSSKNELVCGHGGRFIPLTDDSRLGVWYIGGRLLFQKLSSEDWISRLQKKSDVLDLVEDVNRVANEVEVTMTTLAYLQMAKNIKVTHDWICFDILSKKSSDIWFTVKMDCRDILNAQPSHVTIDNILGETRETDIQNLVTCVKKNSFFFTNYVAVVEEYLEAIERIQ